MNIQVQHILFFIGILKLPFFLNLTLLNIPLGLIFLAVFIQGLAAGKIISFQSGVNRRALFPVTLYFLLVLISYFRSQPLALFDLIYFGSFHLFVIAYVSEIIHWCREENRPLIDGFRKYFINSFATLILLNLGLWFLGFQLSTKMLEEISLGPSVILAQMGFFIERVNFVFSKGINSYAVILGAIFTFLVVDVFMQKRYDWLSLARVFGVLVCIFLTDSRGAIAAPILSLGMIITIRFFKLTFLVRLTPLLFIVIPISIVYILPLLSEVEFISQFSRNNTDLFTMNGRIFVWYFAGEEFLSFKPLHLIGFGYQGHYLSGASMNWSFVFSTYANSEYVHPHNSILSIIFDIGYLGLATVLFILYRIGESVVHHWKKYSINESLTFYSFIFYMMFISITESFITPYYLNAITLFFGYSLFMLSINKKVIIEESYD